MKSSRGTIHKRQQQILQKLEESDTIRVEDLAEALQVTPVTVRRDLEMFEKQGLISRFHGGARLTHGMLKDDPGMAENLPPSRAIQKQKIAKYAADLVEDGDTIFINTSTTCLLMLEYFGNKRVTVITNNGKAINTRRQLGTDLILTGGEYSDHKQSMVGEIAIGSINRVVADKSFIGVSALSVSQGAMSSGLQETAVNNLMMKHCKGNCYVLADGSKIGEQSNFISAPIELVSTLITDASANPHELERMRAVGVQVVVVD